MKRSSAILKSLVVVGILTFGSAASGSTIISRPVPRPLPPIPLPITNRPPIIFTNLPPIFITNRPPIRITNPPPILPPTPISNCTLAPAGLVGWWKGDGNALDSVLGNNGVAQNITYTTGVVSQAFACDPNNFPYGTYTGIQIPDSPAYVLTNSLTIEGWVRPRGDGYNIFWRGDNRPGMDPYFLGMWGNNNIKFQICNQDGDTITVGTTLTYNQWTHVAATLDGSTGTMSIYTNGVLADQTVTTVRPFGDLIPGDSPGVGIGNVNDGQNNFPFIGDIDEISLYNRALSAAEVQAIYNAGSAGKCAVACVSPPSGIVAWWPGEGNANDVVGGNNGTLEGGATFAPGMVGQGFYLNGSNADVRIPAGSSLDVGSGNGLTLEAWINPSDVSERHPLFEWNVGDGTTYWGVHFYIDPLSFGAGPGALYANIVDNNGFWHQLYTGAGVVTPNVFQHVVLTYDKASGVATIYCNGVAVVQQNMGSFTPQTTYNLYLGKRPLTQGETYAFAGLLDEPSVYNRALSSTEIASLYSAGSAGKCPVTAPTCASPPSGLIGWWPGEGNANDVVGGNNGVLEGGVTFAPGMVGQGFYLNGSNADVQIPDSPSLRPANVTVEAWVKLDALASPVAAYPGLQYIVFKKNSRGGNFEGYDLEKNRINGQDVFRFQVTSAAGQQVPAASTTVAQAGIWYHLTGTYDSGTGYVLLYLNGVLEGSAYAGFPLDYDTRPLFIGTTGEGWDGRVQGTVDEVSIYNRALSSNEIASLYHAGSAGKCAGPFPPGITVQPVNQTTVGGSNVVLSVVAGGTGPFSYQWSFNGTNILGATNATLTLTNLHPYQSGNYTVTITTPYGSITSSNASVTVIAQNILVYKYDGIQKIITSGLSLSYPYAGQMFFIPDNTNGVFVGWATIKGKKQYWVNPLPEYLWITIPGAGNQTFTVLGQAGQAIDTNGCPNIWADLYKGQNTELNIGQKKYFSFPNTFTADATHVYPDSQTGKMVLNESFSTFIFMAQSTQNANNNGQTLTDLVNALTKSLASQGYQKQ